MNNSSGRKMPCGILAAVASVAPGMVGQKTPRRVPQRRGGGKSPGGPGAGLGTRAALIASAGRLGGRQARQQQAQAPARIGIDIVGGDQEMAMAAVRQKMQLLERPQAAMALQHRRHGSVAVIEQLPSQLAAADSYAGRSAVAMQLQ